MLTDERLDELRTNIGAVTDGITAAIQMTIAKIQTASRANKDNDIETLHEVLDKQIDLLNATLHMEKNLDNDDSSLNEGCPYEDCYD